MNLFCIFVKLLAAETKEEVQKLLTSDEGSGALSTIKYRGVPTKAPLDSRVEVMRYKFHHPIYVIYILYVIYLYYHNSFFIIQFYYAKKINFITPKEKILVI